MVSLSPVGPTLSVLPPADETLSVLPPADATLSVLPPADPIVFALSSTDAIVFALALAVAVVVGMAVHEWSHALVLRVAGIEYEIAYLPDRAGGALATLASRWAVVRPRPSGNESTWGLRLAALAPLALFPVAAAIAQLPAGPATTATAVGFLACALPSPQDFAVAFHGHRALAVAG